MGGREVSDEGTRNTGSCGIVSVSKCLRRNAVATSLHGQPHFYCR